MVGCRNRQQRLKNWRRKFEWNWLAIWFVFPTFHSIWIKFPPNLQNIETALMSKLREIAKETAKSQLELRTFQRLEENEQKAIVKRMNTITEEVGNFFSLFHKKSGYSLGKNYAINKATENSHELATTHSSLVRALSSKQIILLIPIPPLPSISSNSKLSGWGGGAAHNLWIIMIEEGEDAIGCGKIGTNCAAFLFLHFFECFQLAPSKI